MYKVWCIRLLVYKCTCVKGVITMSVVFLSYTLDLGGGSLPPSPRSHVVEEVPPPWVELEVHSWQLEWHKM